MEWCGDGDGSQAALLACPRATQLLVQSRRVRAVQRPSHPRTCARTHLPVFTWTFTRRTHTRMHAGGASADSVVFVRAAAVAGNVEVVGHLVRLKLGELAGWVRGGYGVQRCGDEKI